MKRERSPVFCNHANECPLICPCDKDCYCKSHTCRKVKKWSNQKTKKQNID